MKPPTCCPGAGVDWEGQSASSGTPTILRWRCRDCGGALTTTPEGSTTP